MIFLNTGSLRYAGRTGYYVASTAESALYAYAAYFNEANVGTADYTNRFYGFTVWACGFLDIER